MGICQKSWGRLQPKVLFHALSVPLCSSRVCDVSGKLNCGRIELFSEVHIQQFFLCKWIFFPPSHIGFFFNNYVLNACEVFSYALTRVDMLRERLCSVISSVLLSSSCACSSCTLVEQTHPFSISKLSHFSWNQSWMLKMADFHKAGRSDSVSSFLDLDLWAFPCLASSLKLGNNCV